MNRTILLFLVIFLEGYVVLSSELLAIRQVIPYLGNGTDTVSLIIAAILMPLAFGYFLGGRFRPGKHGTVRKRLLLNTSLSALILSLGLSFVTMSIFFDVVTRIGVFHNRTEVTIVYSLVFLVLPVFMLGQTVPLISNYFPRQALPKFAGTILFLSTCGSFMGAVFTTLVLMPQLGVHHAVTISIACLTLIAILLSRESFNRYILTAIIAFFLSVFLNSDMVFNTLGIIKNNQYNTIEVRYSEGDASKILLLNNSMASGIPADPDKAKMSAFAYVQYVDKHFIYSRPADAPEIDILALGSGGFTVGLKDTKNKYTFIDIDPDLKDVAEKYFLHEPLTPNKTFIAEEARAFLAQTDRKFDLIFIDAYSNILSFPEHLVTKEFFEQVRDVLNPGGAVIINAIQTPNFSDQFSIRFDNTLRAVFPHVNRDLIESYDGWQQSFRCTNIMYTAYNRTPELNEVYTDDKNTSFFDKRKKP